MKDLRRSRLAARRMLAVSAVVGASLLTASCWWDKPGGSGGAGTPGAGPDSDLSWDVEYENNKLDPALIATATHEIGSGGKINITGRCASDADQSKITFDLDYFTKDDKGDGEASSYDTEGSGNFQHVAIPYRVDGGALQQANSQTDFKNRAQVMFSYISPNAKLDPGAILVIGMAKASGGVQDLRQFLHAQEVDFQLPLGGGGSEIVKLYPQDGGFQKFVAECKIDLKRLDSEKARPSADATQGNGATDTPPQAPPAPPQEAPAPAPADNASPSGDAQPSPDNDQTSQQTQPPPQQ
jgi:hypothetical protein